MWRLYSKADESIAIESNYQRLFDVLDGSCFVGLVDYIDYENEAIPPNNYFNALLRKRKSYGHEHELRALYWDGSAAQSILHPSSNEIDNNEMPDGIAKQIKLGELILGVRIAPNADQWFVDLISNTKGSIV